MGEPIHLDSDGFRPMRLMNLADSLTEHGHEVTVWTNNFDHFSKKYRVEGNSIREIQFSSKLRFMLITSLGYYKNISLRRLVDHIELAIRLSIEIRKVPLPDVCFIGYPPIETAYVVARYLKKKRVPFAVDVKDDWPEIFVRPFPKVLHQFIRLTLSFLYKMMKYVIREASALYAPSQNLLTHFQKVSTRKPSSNDGVIPLTVKRSALSLSQLDEEIDWWKCIGVAKADKLIISFVGSLTDVFDFSPLIELAKIQDIHVVIAGDGPLYSRLNSSVKGESNIFLPGRISQSKAIALGKLSSAFCLPYRDLLDFNSNLPNKFFDCIATGTPIICPDYGLISDTVEKFGLGFTYSGEEVQSLANIISEIQTKPKMLAEISKNANNLYETTFSHAIVYGELVAKLISLSAPEDFPK